MSPGSSDSSGSIGPRCRPAVLFPVGLLIALLGAVCGIGGGLFAVPLLHYGMRLPLRVSVGTSLYLVFSTALAATVSEALRPDSAISWPLLGVLAACALVGTQLGYRASRRIRPRALKLVFFAVLLAAGWRILAAENGSGPAQTTALELNPATLAIAAAIGLAGGFLAPLLGVGGGLLMVPAIFFGLPQIGYLGARAHSLAVAAISSARSLFLYSRERAVHLRCAAFLGTGALAGATAGVVLVHRPGWSGYARVVMGTVLLLVALRFLWDVRQEAGRAQSTPAHGKTNGRGAPPARSGP